MMIMRPPQHGREVEGSSGYISIGWLALGLWATSSSRAPRDVVGTGGLGEQAVVADAVEAGATCPPSAAVRQRSIADITFSWLRLTWPALA